MLDHVGDILAMMEAERPRRRALLCALICRARACQRAKACRHRPCTSLTRARRPERFRSAAQ